MPSDTHQLILRLIMQRMIMDGFQISHWDGKHSKSLGGGEVPLPSPPALGKHKPDILGFHKQHQIWAIGEAKTKSDLLSNRTATQLKEFSSIFMKESRIQCHLYLGIPKEAIFDARKLLVNCLLHGKSNIHLLAFPEILLK